MNEKKQNSRREIKIVNRSRDGQVARSEGGIEIRNEGGPISWEAKSGGCVYLALDCSSSMSGGKLNQAKRGATEFAKEARGKGYLFGLISFSSGAFQVFAPQEEISMLHESIEPLTASGGTNMTAAIEMAAGELSMRGEGEKVIVIATDGMPNDPQSALKAGWEALREGIEIITVGTDDADRDFLQEISSRDDLAVMVSRNSFEGGITSTARMLPEGGRD